MFFGLQKKLKVHLVGIGGSGMSGIAEVLLAAGFEVTGSDLQTTATTTRLASLGAKVFLGHRAENVKDPSCVVVSSAVKKDNPECVEARQLGVPVIARAEMLAELMRLKKGIAVAGSHGKTTTTSILGQLTQSLDPTVVVGGRVQHWNSSSIVGRGDCFIIEADESDRSFLKFSPVYSLVTNIDREHLDNYRDLDDIADTFLEFMNRTAFFGCNWISADCPVLKELRPRIGKPVQSFGLSEEADLRVLSYDLQSRSSRFELAWKSQNLGNFEIRVPGRHNVTNATGAIGLALSLGVSLQAIKDNLRQFQAVERRLQVHGESDSWAVVEDYAHHPTEIRASLEAIRLMYPNFRSLVVFQPHRYTRTQALWEDFVCVLKEHSDQLILLPIYAAHEAPVDGITSKQMADEVGSKARFLESLPNAKEVVQWASSEAAMRYGFVISILGAAPLSSLARAIAQELDSISDPASQESHPVG